MAEQSKTKRTDEEKELLRSLMSAPAVGLPHAVDEETRQTYLDRRRGQAEAYGQFVAKQDIYVPFTQTLAFTRHSAVPVEHVEKWELEDADLVERVASPELARKGVRFEQQRVEKAAELTDDRPTGPADAEPTTTNAGRSTPAAAKK